MEIVAAIFVEVLGVLYIFDFVIICVLDFYSMYVLLS